MAVKIQLRGDTATNWTNTNPVLSSREMAIETDTNKLKIGDGVTSWTSLSYVATGGATLTDGSGTTWNSGTSAVDLGGSLTGDVKINGAFSVAIGPDLGASTIVDIKLNATNSINLGDVFSNAYVSLDESGGIVLIGATDHIELIASTLVSELKLAGSGVATFSNLLSTARDLTIPNLSGNDSFVFAAATQTLTNKTLGSGTKILLGSDATNDLHYNSGGGTLARLVVSNGLTVSSGTFKLGGSITADTDISGGFNFTLGSGTALNRFISSSTALTNINVNDGAGTTSTLEFDASSFKTRLAGAITGKSSEVSIISGDMTITGSLGSPTLTISGFGSFNTGTITSGTWNGSVIGSSYGGAGSVNGILKANGSGTVSAASAGTDYLTPSGSGASLSGVWLSNSGTTLSGANTITGTSSNTLKYAFTSLGTTVTDGAGAYYQNSTAATSGNQQISPIITLEGQGWKTNSTAASQTVAFAQYVLPVQGTANPSGTWLLRSNINGAGYSTVLSVDNIGNGIFSGQVKATSTATTAAINMVGVSGNPSGATAGDMWYETGTGVFRFKPGATVLNMMGAAANSPVASVPFAASVTNQYSFATGFTYSTTTGLAVAHGGLTITQAAASSAWQSANKTTPGANTSMTASTAFNGINTNVAAVTMTWAAGALASQAFNYWDAPTIAFASSSTATDVFNGYFKDPIQGTNATITNKWSLGTEGNLRVGGKVMFASANTTGAGSAALGANSPATTNTAPYTWLTAISSDGSTVYIPCWK